MSSRGLEGARERRVRTDGVELCVAELGDAANPTVVLLHGYPDSKEVWSEVAERLRDRFHVVLYDVRGHGRSTAPEPLRGGFTLEKLTDDFLAVADAVSPDAPVHLVGHDWGSVQGWEFVTVGRTQRRIASFTSISGPSLDHFGHWIKERMARPTPRRAAQLLGQGAKSWYVYALHTPRLPEAFWRGPLAKQWPKVLARSEKLPPGPLPHELAARGRRARRLALPRQRTGQDAPPALRRLRPCARPADHPPPAMPTSRSGSTTIWTGGRRSWCGGPCPPSTGCPAPGPTSWRRGSPSSSRHGMRAGRAGPPGCRWGPGRTRSGSRAGWCW
ncbi:hypothetical protein GCM10020000_39550 [Streptomyces olivoverticillatus]